MKRLAIDTETHLRIPQPFMATAYDGKNGYMYDPEDKRDYRMLKEECESDTIKIFHNAPYDIWVLKNIGINVRPPYHDTMIIYSMIDEFVETRKLKMLAQQFLNEPCSESKLLSKVKTKYKKLAKKENRPFYYSDIPLNVVAPYAVKDAEYTYDLFTNAIRKYPNITDRKLYWLELQLIPHIVAMTDRGIRINRNFCQSESIRLGKLYDKYSQKIIDSGIVMNINSPKQVLKLINDLNIKDAPTDPKTGKPTTNKDAMKQLESASPIFKYISLCRRALKMKSTYYDHLLEMTTADDPYAHFSYWQSSTKTGRFSAELIQTIPKEQNAEADELDALMVRKAFIPRKDHMLWFFDYDQIEMRIFAHVSKNQYLIDAINHGEDPHSATAIDLFGSADGLYRNFAKTINFGLIYGMGVTALIAKLGVSEREGRDILIKYEKKYNIRAYINDLVRILHRQGFIRVDWIGRDYHIDTRLAYKATNYMVQGSAAYVMKLGMLGSARTIKQQYPDSYLLMTVHDELVPETPLMTNTECKTFVAAMKASMESYKLFDVPLTVDVKYTTTSWGEKRKWVGRIE